MERRARLSQDVAVCGEKGVNAFPLTDRWAIASAILGATAIVPILSQLAGLAAGIIALRRIRQAERRGVILRGRGWAIGGIVSSGIVLACWVLILVVMGLLISVFAGMAGTLDQIVLSKPG